MTDRVRRTSAGLRDAIFDEIDAIRAGESSSARANAISKLASGIVKTVLMELEVQKHAHTVGAPASITPLGETLKLGN
jgi:chorismate synthase